MLSEKKVPKTFLPEAVNWAIHVLNRSLTLAVKDVTPEEAWSGNKPYVDYFRVFGCIAYVHTPDARRTKLDDKSVKCVLLGVTEESKAYRLYNPISKKIVISRDVVFAENEVGTGTAVVMKKITIYWSGVIWKKKRMKKIK